MWELWGTAQRSSEGKTTQDENNEQEQEKTREALRRSLVQQMHERKDKGRDQKMNKTGRICYKIAGRNAGKLCVIVDKAEEGYVIIDGNIKRKKCNLKHLEPTDKILDIKKGASSANVQAAMKKEGIEVVKRKAKQEKEKPKKQRMKKEGKTKKKK